MYDTYTGWDEFAVNDERLSILGNHSGKTAGYGHRESESLLHARMLQRDASVRLCWTGSEWSGLPDTPSFRVAGETPLYQDLEYPC